MSLTARIAKVMDSGYAVDCTVIEVLEIATAFALIEGFGTPPVGKLHGKHHVYHLIGLLILFVFWQRCFYVHSEIYLINYKVDVVP